ncbi:hypothetical protein OHA21_05165 [Actinoplanes sp. NBC_00393]|uniref:hypothetical protein n=1 Tax=Actinoplanes sp. NBC_00393 TaxID=2975953 RepID=UPI002E1CC804
MTGIPEPDELVAQLDGRLRQKRRIDLGLSAALPEITAHAPAAGFQHAHQVLLQRAADLQGAIADLSAAMARIRDGERVVRFTELGWPERRAELTAECADRPLDGIADWLDDWFCAVAAYRLDACARLTGIASSLPAGTGILVRRCTATWAALTVRHWEVAAPLLEAGARGVPVGDRIVPDMEVRQDLWMLLVRFALNAGRTEEARRVLEEAGGAGAGPVFRALSHRLEALRPGADPPRADLMRIGAGSAPAMLEMARVLAMSAADASPDLNVDMGMSAARSAVSAARSLDDAEREIVRMLDPVPGEIHLALAERALGEEQRELAERSLRSAADTGQNRAVQAEAHDRLADLAGDTGTEHRELLAAASAWSDVQHTGRALAALRRLLAADPDHIEARCLLGGCLLQLAWSANETEAQAALDEVLAVTTDIPALVEAQRPRLTNADWLLAWGYFNESYVRARLSRYAHESEKDQQWRALAAAFRAVALQPANGSMWVSLADAAYELGLWSMAELASEAAARIAPTRDNVAEHIRALINVGEFERALDVLSEPRTEFEWNMKAHLMLRLGRPAGAVGIFAGHPPEAHAAWAKISHILALLLAGSRPEAIAAAKDVDTWLRTRLADRSNWSSATRVGLLTGDHERVELYAGKMRQAGMHEGDFDLAVVRVAQDRLPEAEELLVSYIDAFTSLDSVASWDKIERPLLDLLDTGGRVDRTRPLQALDAVRARLQERRDPAAEFRAADGDGVDPDIRTAAGKLGRVVMAMAADDRTAVEQGVADLDDVVSPAVRTWLEGGHQEPEQTLPAEFDQTPQPAELLLLLPLSWFPGAEDPNVSHPLFLRHLPEMRLSARTEIPGLRVTTDTGLEPAGYRIVHADVIREEGVLPAGRRLLPAAACDLLPAEISAEAEPEKQPALQELGDCTIPEPGPDSFAALLSLNPLEAVSRRVEAAARGVPITR